MSDDGSEGSPGTGSCWEPSATNGPHIIESLDAILLLLADLGLGGDSEIMVSRIHRRVRLVRVSDIKDGAIS